MTERMKKLHKDNRGVTLMEMIVTFALVGIFLASAVAVISSAVVTHSELTAAMYAQSVGEALLDKIAGELAAAQPIEEEAILIRSAEEEGMSETGSVRFFDREGRQVLCGTQNGLLLFWYPAVEDEKQQTEENGQKTAEGYTWMLDENAYMGFRITDMQFVRLNEKNVIEVQITIQNLKTGFEYSTSRCAGCYNFKTEEEYKRIVEKTDHTDTDR